MYHVIVVGAGASGLMAAGRAAELGARVLLLEKTERPGKKLLITGKSRCNLTNSLELDDFVAAYGPNGRFLYSAFHRYFRDDLLAFLKSHGVDAVTEVSGRIFPAPGDARDVARSLQRYAADHSVHVQTGTRATAIQMKSGRVTGVQTEQGAYPAGAIVLATGGASYPETGSAGDGFRMAEAIGHTIVKLRPGAVPLVVHEVQRARSMQGASLRNVRLTAYRCRAEEVSSRMTPAADFGRGTGHDRPPAPVIESRLGDMMMTHFGISGPVTLQMSLAIVDSLETGPVSVSIDLVPALTERQLHSQLQHCFNSHGRRSLCRILGDMLPHRIVGPLLEMAAIPPGKHGSQVSLEERTLLVEMVKCLRFNIERPRPLAEAMVTAGGVSLKEIAPRTMASRLIRGLYFCGEVMDIDGDTGGFNLQAAFSTGYVAGEQAAACASRPPL